ncbi:glutamine ABC transporter substrate-binding protein, partial [Streptococcus suis]
ERKKELAFSDSYYTSIPTLVVRSDSQYANATSLEDFAGAQITAQQGVYLSDLIDPSEGANKQTALGAFSQRRQALESGRIAAYVSERPEGRTAAAAHKAFKRV